MIWRKEMMAVEKSTAEDWSKAKIKEVSLEDLMFEMNIRWSRMRDPHNQKEARTEPCGRREHDTHQELGGDRWWRAGCQASKISWRERHEAELAEPHRLCGKVSNLWSLVLEKLPRGFNQNERWTKNCKFLINCNHMKNISGDFPGGPVVKTSPSSAGRTGSTPGWGIEIPHGLWPKNQNKKHVTL